MDTSETYVKLCKKAEEIQKLFREQVGDYLYMPKDGECAIVAENYREYRVLVSVVTEKSFAFDDPFTWLPRQDQLQEMMGSDWIKTFDSFTWWMDTHYGTGVDEFYFEKCDDFTSMEQLWLAFVMKERYQKKWDGKDWVKE